MRGSIVPVVDLRMRLNLDRAEYTAVTVIIVLSIDSGHGKRNFGVVVDGVSDVINIQGEDIKPPPELGPEVNTDYIQGLATVSDRMVMLLDIDRLIGIDIIGVSSMSAVA